ncbi:MAG: DsbA family oxidoreductase [Thermoleophilia bacterium]
MGQVAADHVKEKHPGAVIEWKPFMLRPDMPPEGVELSLWYRATPEREEARQRLRARAQELGLPIKFSAHIPNSRRALEASEYANSVGKGSEFHRAVLHQFFAEGRDISDWEVLRQAAIDAGIDAGEMQRRTESGEFAAAVTEQDAAARAAGVHAAPTYFINDEVKIVGAQRDDVFEEAIARLAKGENARATF